MSKTLEIKQIDLAKKRAYTSTNGTIRLSPSFRLVFDSDLVITTEMGEKEQFKVIKKAIKTRKISLSDLIVAGRTQRKKAFETMKKLAVKSGSWDGTAEVVNAREKRKMKYKDEPGIFQIAGTVPAKIKITHKTWHQMRDEVGRMMGRRVLRDLK